MDQNFSTPQRAQQNPQAARGTPWSAQTPDQLGVLREGSSQGQSPAPRFPASISPQHPSAQRSPNSQHAMSYTNARATQQPRQQQQQQQYYQPPAHKMSQRNPTFRSRSREVDSSVEARHHNKNRASGSTGSVNNNNNNSGGGSHRRENSSRAPHHQYQQQQQQQHPPRKASPSGNSPDEDRRRCQRDKQIHFGYATDGYRNMERLIEHDPLLKSGGLLPLSPPTVVKGSKRIWDIQLRKWRRALHMFDYVFIDGEDDPATKSSVVEEQRQQWVSEAFQGAPREARKHIALDALRRVQHSAAVPTKIPVEEDLKCILRSDDCYESVRSVVPQSASSLTKGTDISPLEAGIKIHIAPSTAVLQRQLAQQELQQRLTALQQQQQQQQQQQETSAERTAQATPQRAAPHSSATSPLPPSPSPSAATAAPPSQLAPAGPHAQAMLLSSSSSPRRAEALSPSPRRPAPPPSPSQAFPMSTSISSTTTSTRNAVPSTGSTGMPSVASALRHSAALFPPPPPQMQQPTASVVEALRCCASPSVAATTTAAAVSGSASAGVSLSPSLLRSTSNPSNRGRLSSEGVVAGVPLQPPPPLSTFTQLQPPVHYTGRAPVTHAAAGGATSQSDMMWAPAPGLPFVPATPSQMQQQQVGFPPAASNFQHLYTPMPWYDAATAVTVPPTTSARLGVPQPCAAPGAPWVPQTFYADPTATAPPTFVVLPDGSMTAMAQPGLCGAEASADVRTPSAGQTHDRPPRRSAGGATPQTVPRFVARLSTSPSERRLGEQQLHADDSAEEKLALRRTTHGVGATAASTVLSPEGRHAVGIAGLASTTTTTTANTINAASAKKSEKSLSMSDVTPDRALFDASTLTESKTVARSVQRRGSSTQEDEETRGSSGHRDELEKGRPQSGSEPSLVAPLDFQEEIA